LPKRLHSATQPDTAPGTVTGPQPRIDIAARPSNALRACRAGERPDAFSPTTSPPKIPSTNPSPPIPLVVGSSTVIAAAVATAASAALPPRRSISSPACAASGWLVATAIDPQTAGRRAS